MRSLVILCLITAVFVAAIVSGIFWLKSDNGSGLKKNYDFRLPLIEGGELAFAAENVATKIAIVNFWATWCEPCQREFPTLIKSAEQLGPDYLFILISLDDDERAVTNFLKTYPGQHDNVKILWDRRSAIATAFGTSQLPETYLFSKKRHFERKVIGYVDWTQQDVTGYLRVLNQADGSR